MVCTFNQINLQFVLLKVPTQFLYLDSFVFSFLLNIFFLFYIYAEIFAFVIFSRKN